MKSPLHQLFSRFCVQWIMLSSQQNALRGFVFILVNLGGGSQAHINSPLLGVMLSICCFYYLHEAPTLPLDKTRGDIRWEGKCPLLLHSPVFPTLPLLAPVLLTPGCPFSSLPPPLVPYRIFLPVQLLSHTVFPPPPFCMSCP